MPLIEKSAARGEPRAQYILGTALFNGENIGKDWKRAYATMTRANNAGLPQAAKSLSLMNQYIPLKDRQEARSEEHTSELQSLMRTSYAVFCLKKKKHKITIKHILNRTQQNEEIDKHNHITYTL